MINFSSLKSVLDHPRMSCRSRSRVYSSILNWRDHKKETRILTNSYQSGRHDLKNVTVFSWSINKKHWLQDLNTEWSIKMKIDRWTLNKKDESIFHTWEARVEMEIVWNIEDRIRLTNTYHQGSERIRSCRALYLLWRETCLSDGRDRDEARSGVGRDVDRIRDHDQGIDDLSNFNVTFCRSWVRDERHQSRHFLYWYVKKINWEEYDLENYLSRIIWRTFL